jgi:hypothetical protein
MIELDNREDGCLKKKKDKNDTKTALDQYLS